MGGRVSTAGMLLFLFALTQLPAWSSGGSHTPWLRPESSAARLRVSLREARIVVHAPLLRLRGGQSDESQASAGVIGSAPGATRSESSGERRESDHAEVGSRSEDEDHDSDQESTANRTTSSVAHSGEDDGLGSSGSGILSTNDDQVRDFAAELEARYGAGNQTLLGEEDELGGETFSISTDDERVSPPAIRFSPGTRILVT
ncbi:hypothetical protein T484DRAFT_1751129 [Baffinella frigidus]|nr:hypothetical protein T484DRAFT_1751129 [Cryptophyta sp. CCMP2293]